MKYVLLSESNQHWIKTLHAICGVLNGKDFLRSSCTWIFGPQLVALLGEMVQLSLRTHVTGDRLREFTALPHFQSPLSLPSCLWFKMSSLSFLLQPPTASPLSPLLTLPSWTISHNLVFFPQDGLVMAFYHSNHHWLTVCNFDSVEIFRKQNQS